jgi:predicted negative regulator of RcsB-dependent stress response
MSQETIPSEDAAKSSAQPIPKNLPIELLPLYDWWKTSGMQFLITLVTAAILIGGAYAFKQYRASKISTANKELLQANTLEDLESVVSKYSSTKAGNAARLRLAKAYYDASKYEDALNVYDTCLSKGAPMGFAEVAQIGRCHALEGLNRLDEALAGYEAFNKASASHFLHPQAQMGIARIYTLQGKKDEAKKLLETLKAQKTNNPAWEMALANLEGVVARYEPRAARSLFEAANEAAAKPVTPPAPVQVPAPVKK